MLGGRKIERKERVNKKKKEGRKEGIKEIRKEGRNRERES